MEKPEKILWALVVLAGILGTIAWNIHMPSALSLVKEGEAKVLEGAAEGSKKAKEYLQMGAPHDRSPLQGTVEHYKGMAEKYRKKDETRRGEHR